jgi:hypothetical protein
VPAYPALSALALLWLSAFALTTELLRRGYKLRY